MKYYNEPIPLNTNKEDYNPWNDLGFYIPMLPLIVVLFAIIVLILYNLIRYR